MKSGIVHARATSLPWVYMFRQTDFIQWQRKSMLWWSPVRLSSLRLPNLIIIFDLTRINISAIRCSLYIGYLSVFVMHTHLRHPAHEQPIMLPAQHFNFCCDVLPYTSKGGPVYIFGNLRELEQWASPAATAPYDAPSIIALYHGIIGTVLSSYE